MTLEQENRELRHRVAELERLLDRVQSWRNPAIELHRDAESLSLASLRAELQTSEELFRAYVETANDMVYRVDLGGRLTYINDYGQRLLECSPEDWKGRQYLDFVTPNCREATAQAFATLLTTGELKDFEFSLQPLKGEPVHMQVNGRLLYQHGQPIGGMGIARNITERKRSERELQIFRKALESAYDSVVIADIEGRIVYANPATDRMFGYEPDSTLGRKAAMFYSEEARSQIEWLLQQVLFFSRSPRSRKAGFSASPVGGSNREMICQRRSGERFPALVSVSPIPDENGCPTAISIVCRDITAQKQSQQELAAKNRELEQASRHKSAFLANMSHELRTPLSSILGFSSVLAQQIYGVLTDKQLEYIQCIHSSGKHLLDLIKELLDLSKLEAGKVKLEIQPIEIDRLCKGTLDLLGDQIDAKKLKLHFEIEPDLPPLMADEKRVRQMLINLLSNAIKFSPDRSEIGLEVTAEDSHLHLMVWDRGIGIPEEKQNLLFQPFQQIDSIWGRSIEGTGLGLALTRQLVELHGGTIGCCSKIGQGCKFTISLPIVVQQESAEKEREAGRLAPRETPTAEPSQLLLVEDRQDNATLLRDILKHWGYKVHHVDSGEDALEWLSSHNPDLILMDLQLPGKNGLEVTRQIKAHPQWKAIPVIATTARAMMSDREQCFEAGMDGYLSKPFSGDQLSALLAKHLKSASVKHLSA
jgi:PAS domain S-box-containing protein